MLFGLALIGEGGRNYVAAKCIEAIDDLSQEPALWLQQCDSGTKTAGDPLWSIFRRAMTEPLGRTAAYAFLADALCKTENEQEWAAHFSPSFRRHLETLESVGLVDELLRLSDITPYVNFRKNQLLKIILAAARFDIDTVTSSVQMSPVDRQIIKIDERSRIDRAVSAVSSLTRVLHLTWKVDPDGSLPSICTEVRLPTFLIFFLD